MARPASATKKPAKQPAKKATRSAPSKAKPAPEPAPTAKAAKRRLEVGPSNAEVIESTLQRAIDQTIEHADLVKVSDGREALEDRDAVIIAKHGQLYRVRRPAATRAAQPAEQKKPRRGRSDE